MRIARVYCVEVGKIVDIYGARALFFAQDEPRRRFEFLCSDDACRAARATKVTGINYDKLVGQGDRVVQKPHFRMNFEHPHIAACEWVLRAQDLDARDSRSPEGPRTACTAGRVRNLKSGDLVDAFLPNFPAAAVTQHRGADAALSHAAESKQRAGRDSPKRQATCTATRSRADFLETVTSAYELLEPGERREATLRIGQGPKLSYHKAFCQIANYFAASGGRIFHGGVRVRLHGPNFAVCFFDRAARPGEDGSKRNAEVSLYLKRQMLEEHWNGKFLTALLSEAAKPGHYAHCYFFGQLVSHPTRSDRLVVTVDNLDHLVFTVRTFKQQ